MEGITRMDVEERACHGSDEDAKAGYAELTTAGLCNSARIANMPQARVHGMSVLDMPMRSARVL